MTSRHVLQFGTRGSALARVQTDLVIRRLQTLHPEIECEIVVIQTEGDHDKETPLNIIGGRGVFTNALQDALRRSEIDVAVHSAKDLPTERPHDLTIAAFLERADPRDVLVSRHGLPLAELAPHPVIGTSSRRRQAQVLRLRPDAQLVDLRGNIDTRLRKAAETELDGIVLAAAGIERMGWSDRITEYLPLEIAVPSPGQGALAVEIRADDIKSSDFVHGLNQWEVSRCVEVERTFLRGIGGGCTSPVGAHATIEVNQIRLRAMLGSADLAHVEWIDELLTSAEAEASAESLAKAMLSRVEAGDSTSNISGRSRPPLEGKRILVTRKTANDRLVCELRYQGATVLTVPAIHIEPVASDILDQRISVLGRDRYDWVVFTSANAVSAFLERAKGVEIIEGALIAAVGQTTQERLRGEGLTVSLVPATSTGEALVSEMTKRNLAGMRVLLPRGNRARPTVQDGLQRAGAVVDSVDVYETVLNRDLAQAVMHELLKGTLDSVIFSSPSSVEAITSALGERVDLLDRAIVACIGPTTAEAARIAGLKVSIVPPTSSVDSLVNEITNYFGRGQEGGAIA